MKFQSIIHYLLLIVVVRNGDAQQQMTGRLSKEENAERLRTCGATIIDRPSIDSTAKELRGDNWQTWLSFVRFENAKHQSAKGAALATMISSRHFLTSSQVVMNDDRTWRWNSEKVVGCESGQNHLKVPPEILDSAQLLFRDRHSMVNQFHYKSVKHAVILNYCNQRTTYFDKTQAVMVAETDDTPNRGFPCLVDATTAMYVNHPDVVDVYTLSVTKEGVTIVTHRKLNIIGNGIDLFFFPVFHEVDTRGGPIMKQIQDKWTLIALGTVGNEKYSLAFNISTLEKDLCDEVGVCGSVPTRVAPPPVAPAAPPTTQPPPPAEIFIPTHNPPPPPDVQPPSPPPQTPEPVPTRATAGTSSNHPEATPPPPTSPPKPSPEAPSPRAAPPAKRREDEEADEDYEMFLKNKKEKEEAEMYENEDTDILISKDDFNDCDGRRGGLQSILLCLFVFYWFLCE
ncbi:hypothetical protein GCK72_003345 [Caenorhabditis remanei]|uniref:Uncharacterized protein n=1 Tax=Caenorhabditis remanei TaxID=31234 RepID=A0A6A5HU87_CAERE|nr:hypothetical protein GCK72_003345 [Caenorhabditis remanei]KAF1771518.1 hypothetical protein GCK72_003345 [Caenorhabditis remanei]